MPLIDEMGRSPMAGLLGLETDDDLVRVAILRTLDRKGIRLSEREAQSLERAGSFVLHEIMRSLDGGSTAEEATVPLRR